MKYKITKQDIQNEINRRNLEDKEKKIKELKNLSDEKLNELLNEK